MNLSYVETKAISKNVSNGFKIVLLMFVSQCRSRRKLTQPCLAKHACVVLIFEHIKHGFFSGKSSETVDSTL